MPDDNVGLLLLVESPVLQRVDIKRRCPDVDAMLYGLWRKGMTTMYGSTVGATLEREKIMKMMSLRVSSLW
jgi:hypothetical protein